MRTYKLHLIRHGMTKGNEKGQYIGSTDIGITTNGIIELENLKEKGIYPKCDIIFSSPLKRAVQTAEIIFPEKEIIVNQNLREMDFGQFEGKTAEELKDNPAYAEWVAGKIQAAPGGESGVEFATRLCEGIGEIIREMMNRQVYSAGVVMHGGAIMTLLSVSAVPRRRMSEWACGNGRGYTVRITPSLYQRSGILEVIAEIPEGGANLITGPQRELMEKYGQ